ncbi:MAG: hypothetical protein QME90_02415 [Thermodesulfobacteriota bacterium]|nr:hypothetical protein [Thermodesulfobacteriota bacterium]
MSKLCFLSSLVVVLTGVSLLLGSAPSPAAPTVEKPYYEGKVITVWVPQGAGSGDDPWIRLLGTHLRRYIPGNPSIVIRNQPAAGGLVACNSAWASKPDGLTVLLLGGKTNLNNILRPKGIEYKLEEGYPILGEADGLVLYARPGMVKEPKDIMTAKGLIYGHSSPTSGPGSAFVWFKELLGFQTEKVIWGYKGSADAWFAFISGEINFSGGSTGSYNFITKPFAEKGEVVPILHGGLIGAKGDVVKEPAAPNVPTIKELYQQIFGKAPSGIAWDVCLLQIGLRTLGKGIVLPPQTPKHCVELLSKAAIEVTKDPKFVNEAEKLGPGVFRLVGEDLVTAFRLGVTARPEVVEYMKKVYLEKYNVLFQ